MRLAYGSYVHADAEVTVAVTRDPVVAETGRQIGYAERWTINGVLQAADPAALTAAMRAMEAAYSANGGDLVLYHDDGTTPSAHRMVSANAVGGVKVSPPSWRDGAGAEYVNRRSYTIDATAEFHVADAGYVSYRETVSFEGGGPRYVFLQPVTGPPVRQQVASNTPYRAFQAGQAVGHRGWPSAPQPMFPGALAENPRVTFVTPDVNAGSPTNWVTAWSYVYESATPLVGLPSIPG